MFSKLAYIDFREIFCRQWRKYHTGIHRARFMSREARKRLVGLRSIIFIISINELQAITSRVKMESKPIDII